jgi:ribosomal-protein-alanine N-acetyltransferase
MQFIFRPVDEVTVRTFLRWRYDPPYDIYNPDPDEIEDEVRYFMDPKNACYGITDDAGDLVAYCTFGPDGQVPGGDYSSEGLDIGLGVRPDLTGKGRGSVYVGAVLDFGRREFAPNAFRVTVAEFNKRALSVWEKAGFTRVQRFERRPDGRPFVVLMRDAG